MGDQLGLHVRVRLRLGLGRLDFVRLQHGIWGAMVSVPRQTGVGDLRGVPHGPGDRYRRRPRACRNSTFPMATLIFFQFVFAAITVIILAGSVLGRMNFTAWVIFCPVWMTLVYTVGAFSLWGGGWLAVWACGLLGRLRHPSRRRHVGICRRGLVGPRLQADRELFPPNSLLVALIGAGILWLGWNGFNGGDPYFANPDAGAAVLNTNTATARLLVWTLMDKMAYGKPSIIGAINGMIAGLVAITPAAGYVNGWGAIIIGVFAGIIPWLS